MSDWNNRTNRTGLIAACEARGIETDDDDTRKDLKALLAEHDAKPDDDDYGWDGDGDGGDGDGDTGVPEPVEVDDTGNPLEPSLDNEGRPVAGVPDDGDGDGSAYGDGTLPTVEELNEQMRTPMSDEVREQVREGAITDDHIAPAPGDGDWGDGTIMRCEYYIGTTATRFLLGAPDLPAIRAKLPKGGQLVADAVAHVGDRVCVAPRSRHGEVISVGRPQVGAGPKMSVDAEVQVRLVDGSLHEAMLSDCAVSR